MVIRDFFIVILMVIFFCIFWIIYLVVVFFGFSLFLGNFYSFLKEFFIGWRLINILFWLLIIIVMLICLCLLGKVIEFVRNL